MTRSYRHAVYAARAIREEARERWRRRYSDMHKAGCETLEEYEQYVREQLGYDSIDAFEAHMRGEPRSGSPTGDAPPRADAAFS